MQLREGQIISSMLCMHPLSLSASDHSEVQWISLKVWRVSPSGSVGSQVSYIAAQAIFSLLFTQTKVIPLKSLLKGFSAAFIVMAPIWIHIDLFSLSLIGIYYNQSVKMSPHTPTVMSYWTSLGEV